MVSEVSGYFNEPFLKKDRVFYRQYQNNIINKCKGRNSLIVLPTGLGKTIIGVLLIGKTLEKYPETSLTMLQNN